MKLPLQTAVTCDVKHSTVLPSQILTVHHVHQGHIYILQRLPHHQHYDVLSCWPPQSTHLCQVGSTPQYLEMSPHHIHHTHTDSR